MSAPRFTGAFVVSPEPHSALATVQAPEAVPDDARVIAVRWPDVFPKDVALRLRQRNPGACLVAWLREPNPDAVDSALRAGFDDVCLTDSQLIHYVGLRLRDVDQLEALVASERAQAQLAQLIDEMSRHPELHDILRVSVLRLSELFAIDRVSVVLWKPGEDVGFVVMETNQNLNNLVIRISEYPELGQIIQTRQPLVISDVFANRLLKGVRSRLEEAGVEHRSAVLFPLMRKNEAVGALFLRSHSPMQAVDDRLLRIGRLVASVTSVAIGNAMEHELLLSEQRALLRDKETATEELAALRQFTEFFAQAHDGILVTHPDGRIRYANSAAASMLGRSTGSLVSRNFISLVSERSRVLAERALEGDAVGDIYGYVDLLMPVVGESEIVISAAIRALHEPRGVMISFRDVTELREIESELRQTKEFLENLIQSSVDGIIAADTDGTIILFNRAAEHIVGRPAHEVVGRMKVSGLYPPGEAMDIMRRLRSEAYGGRGRLQETRKELLTSRGTTVPIHLTAAIIYEGAEEVATVGIFTDLRERLKMEQKLAQIQEKLQISERQAVAAELAGAAAHELNQPLTSIMGYGEMLKRRVEDADPNRKAIDVICRETERMAGIVRKIGEITSYKTTSYVGGSTILDLDGKRPQPNEVE